MTSLLEKFVKKFGRLPTETDPDYLEMLRMGKFRVLDSPDIAPSKCANCGSAKVDGRKYLDFGLTIPWYGVVFLCGHCLNEIVKELDLFQSFNNRIRYLESVITDMKATRDNGERLHELVSKTATEIKEHYDNLLSDVSGFDLIRPPGVGISKEESSKSGVNESEQRVVKPNSGSGSKNILSLADILGNP